MMLRQRLRNRTPKLVIVSRVLLFLVAAALVCYGLMVILLAFKIAPDTVDEISGYRTAFEELSFLTPSDVDGPVRAIVAMAGVLAFLLFGWLAFKELPRPYLARGDLELGSDERGELSVEPRAIERAAEIAACEHPSVSSASGRYGNDDLEIAVSVRRARGLPETLDDVQERVRASLERHGLPAVPVHVNLTGYDRRQRRELN
ncbi:MAG: hypothetical protein ACR2ML_05610 [Solirubrobacteraceae bacterium]